MKKTLRQSIRAKIKEIAPTAEYVQHQFELFKAKENRPKTKIPISAERIREAKAALESGNYKDLLVRLSEMRESLENYDKRLSNKYKPKTT